MTTVFTLAGCHRHTLAFGLAALAVWTASAALMAGPKAAEPVITGVSLDLTLFVPALYWFFVVRGAGAPAVSVVPVFLLGLAAAPLILPQGAQGALPAIRWIAVPAELLLLGLVARALVRARRQTRDSSVTDVHDRIRAAARAALGRGRAADVVAYEMSLLWYALLSWRSRSAPGAGEAFTVHRKSGHAAVVIGLLLAIAAEIVPVHVLIAQLSGVAAWIVTALSMWGALWLIGDWRAMQLRPCTLEHGQLALRMGLRWGLEAPISMIADIRVIGRGESRVTADLIMGLRDAKRVRIEFAEPVEALGVYGRRARVRTVLVGVDGPEPLVQAVAEAMS